MDDSPRSTGRAREPLAWRDGRAAAQRSLRPGQTRTVLRAALLVLVVAAATIIWKRWTGALPAEQRAVLLLLMLAIGLWITEAVPAFAVGLGIIGFLVFALGTPLLLDEPLDVKPYVDTWASPVVWLMLGGFFLAAGMSRTGLDRHLLARAIRPAGSRPRRVLLAIMLTSAVASMFISNTSTTVLVIGAVQPLVRRLPRGDLFGRRVLVAIPLAASVGGMGTIIGSAPNAIAVGVAAEFGPALDFLGWMRFGTPIALTLVVVAWWFLTRSLPVGVGSVEVDFGAEAELPGRRERAVVAAVAAMTVGLWMTTPLHGIPAAMIALIPIVCLSLAGIVDAAQVRGLPWDTLMLVAGGLALGAAVVETGLAARLVSGLGFLTALGPLAVLAILSLVTVVLSNFMSNTATVSLLLPIAVAFHPGHELETCLVLGLSASCALLLPVSTPPNAIALSTGDVEARDLRPGGLLVGLLGPVLILAWVLLMV
jgi:sodium-dependent dicarboxylate transporter 2/3/5